MEENLLNNLKDENYVLTDSDIQNIISKSNIQDNSEVYFNSNSSSKFQFKFFHVFYSVNRKENTVSYIDQVEREDGTFIDEYHKIPNSEVRNLYSKLEISDSWKHKPTEPLRKLLRLFQVDGGKSFWKYAIEVGKYVFKQLANNYTEGLYDEGLTEKEKNFLNSFKTISKYNMFELKTFDDYLNEGYDEVGLITLLNRINVESKYDDFFEITSDISDPNDLGEGIAFTFLGNHYMIYDYGKDYEKFTREYMAMDGRNTSDELDKFEKGKLYAQLEIAGSFKNEVGSTEPAFLSSIYDVTSARSFWKQAVERSKLNDAWKQDLVNMSDNFDVQYGKDLTEDELNYIKSLTGVNRYNMFELKTFEDFNFDDDSNSIVDDWLESNNFHNDMGKWSSDSTFTVTIPDYMVNDDGYLKVSFGTIGGNFEISDVGLISLKGCPETVGGDFECTNTQIESLEFMPNEIDGGLYVINNRIKSLEHLGDSTVKSYINVSHNRLTDLNGCPYNISGGFKCSNNELTNLEGGPGEISGGLDISNNNITTLYGAPRSVGGEIKMDNVGSVTETEEAFYKEKKGYDNYYEDLLKWILENDRVERDLDTINWPEDFLRSKGNILRSVKSINKFGLGLEKKPKK